MRRRDFIALFGGTATVWPLAARAQQLRKLPRIGYLTTGSIELTRVSVEAFYQGLREYGYIDGQNILIEVRAADSKAEQLSALASELVHLNVDLIVAPNTFAARAVQQVTKTIPIVVPVMGDPVGDGLVASLARPGGNITGLTFLGPQLVPKRLALLKEALPAVSRIDVLWHPAAFGERTIKDMVNEAEEAARTLGVQLRLVAVHGPDDFAAAFSTIAGEPADALLVFPSPMLFIERRRIVDFAAEYRLPVFAQGKEYVLLGALMSYGADLIDFVRRSASYIDKILRGARPADLPVEQPTKFELFINLKTAKQLGIEIPATLLARADEVIE